jgi:hypothetical protein
MDSMAFAIVLLILVAGVIFYIIRPGSPHVDPKTPAAPAPKEPTSDVFSASKLTRMKKKELLQYANDHGVEASEGDTKASIVERVPHK